MEYIKTTIISTKEHLIKMFTDQLFYIGGVVGGSILAALSYLTGLNSRELFSVFVLIILDIVSRIWAEKANKRPILSKKMYAGFTGKVLSYSILFIAANHAFFIGEYLKYIFLSGFALIEIRSIYENLQEAKQNHLSIIGKKILQEEERYLSSSREEIKETFEQNKQMKASKTGEYDEK